jgi:hypothetical protein
VRQRAEHGYLFSESGIHCPLCGGRMSRGSLFCGHCRRDSRFRLDANKIRAVARDIHLPRAIHHSLGH